MAINFPTAPSTGQEYTYLGKTWEYNGTGWVPVPGSIVTIPAGRELLIAARTYYVATTGSDSNNGLAIGTPFLTIQKAIDVISGTLDVGIYEVIIQVADGTYASALALKLISGSGTVTIRGNLTTPANCIISAAGTSVINHSSPCSWSIEGFKLTCTTAGDLLRIAGFGTRLVFKLIDFGAAGWGHIRASNGASVICSGNYSISGGGQGHYQTEGYGHIQCNVKTITITGTPNFTASFAYNDRGFGLIDVFGNTFSGSATGTRYTITKGGICFVNGADTLYLPGSIAGTTSTGGQYL